VLLLLSHSGPGMILHSRERGDNMARGGGAGFAKSVPEPLGTGWGRSCTVIYRSRISSAITVFWRTRIMSPFLIVGVMRRIRCSYLGIRFGRLFRLFPARKTASTSCGLNVHENVFYKEGPPMAACWMDSPFTNYFAGRR